MVYESVSEFEKHMNRGDIVDYSPYLQNPSKYKDHLHSMAATKCIYCDKPTVERYDDEYCCSRCRFETERLNNYALLASIGVPFNDLGEPVGI